ncbi:ABC transporter permease [Stygiolobus caldivivus]|uniref:Peptide transporter n=1 Tax=Stygiolobus caldivivus TaxID=2824673 RepID=A0A8D5ZJ24_9CREN|nr:ABC transporter permease [Stygiolobus caldivivus]BCU70156.1 peptide transporter [Stygiolobus caldivivus]
MNRVLRDLLHRKSFIISLAILIFFVLIAVIGPMTTPYKNPYSSSEYYVAGPYAVPSWATIFPQYKDYPPDMSATLNLTSSSGNGQVSYNGSYYVVYLKPKQSANLTFTLDWKYSYPYSFTFSTKVIPYTTQGVQVNVYGVNTSGYKFFLLSYVPSIYQFEYNYPTSPLNLNTPNPISVSPSTLNPSDSPYVASLPYSQQALVGLQLPVQLMGKPGPVSVIVSVINIGSTPAKVYIAPIHFSDLGRAFGILGTDDNGASVYAEYVIGARFDLELSVVASILIVGIGLIFGLIAGYVGGKTDLVLNSLTDFFLTIPGLPLLISLETVFVVTGIAAKISKPVLILLIIGGLSWMGTMKIIRSVTLSVRSRTFVEASRAMGGGPFHIIRKHILPNILGVVFAQLAYDVPVVILIESGLDFLGFGISLSEFPTWGNMLGAATDAASSANSFAWWWVIPPGLSIVLLSVAFYYFGTALQDVLSPFKVRGE